LNTVLVTGYGGFLGSSLCRKLLDAGYRVRGLARNPYPSLARLGVECVQGDACDANACRLAVQDMDVVIHTAALAGVWGRRRDYEAINIRATDNLLDASRDAGVRAFVYCSSPSVTFDGQPQSNIDESVPYPTRWLCDYPRTKAIAEQNVLSVNQPDRLATCALRPHLIWGQDDPHLIPRVISKCKSKRLRCVGDGRNLIDTVHVDSAAEAHFLAMKALLGPKTEAAGRAFFITDGEPIACWDWISLILEYADLKAPSRKISMRAAYRIGSGLECIYNLLGMRSEPPMTRFVALQLGVDHFFSIDAAKRILGYSPAIDRRKILAEMRPWLQKLAE
jgi:nucleoside-diphosphate-sugar epimerase